MKMGALVIVLLLLAGCAANPPHCDRRLTRINAFYRAHAHAGAGGP